MDTHSLSSRPTDGDQPSPLVDGQPALRVELRERTVAAVNGGMASLIGRGVEEIVGTALADLWAPQERAAIAARFDDAVLLGHDVVGALALTSATDGTVWVEADVRFHYRGGQRIDVLLTPLDRLDEEDVCDEPPVGDPSVSDEPALAAVAPPADTPPADLPPVDAAPAAAPEAQSAAIAESGPDPESEPEPEPGPDPDPDPKPEPDPHDMAFELAAATVMATLEAAGAPALWVDAEGMVVSATHCAGRELGVEVADIRGCPLNDVVVLSTPARNALAVARDGRMRQTVLDGGDASDQKHVVEWVPGSEQGAGFVVFSTPGSNADAGETERHRFQAQMVSHVSHDLRGAMAAVFCGLQVVADGLPEGDPLHASVVQALDDSRRANRIIDEVLAVTRPGMQRRADVDLGRLLSNTMDHHRQLADTKSIQIEEDIDDSLHLSGDRSALERAFSNVIDNGLLATPEGGKLVLTVVPETRAGPGAHVAIADTGSGIPPELQPNIFEPFVSDRDGGTGLGLAITRRIVLEHEGQIDFETEEGIGTTFHIWLPCTP